MSRSIFAFRESRVRMKEPMGSIVGGKNSLSKEAGLLLRESSIWKHNPSWKRGYFLLLLLIDSREKSVNISLLLMRVNSFRGIGSMRLDSLSTIG